MTIAVKFRPEIQEHIDAKHFSIYPKAWMGQRRIWLWTKTPDATVGGACATQKEAEDAALAWWEGQSAG